VLTLKTLSEPATDTLAYVRLELFDATPDHQTGTPMFMINLEDLKPNIDAAELARQAWHAEVEVWNQYDMHDEEGYRLAEKRALIAELAYNGLARDVARMLKSLIDQTEKEFIGDHS
jgi:hypothetical protein